MYLSLASNSWRDCTELVSVESSIIFKFCRHRVNTNPNFVTVTLFSGFKIYRHGVNAVLETNIYHQNVILFDLLSISFMIKTPLELYLQCNADTGINCVVFSDFRLLYKRNLKNQGSSTYQGNTA